MANISGLDQNSRRTLSALSSVDNTTIVNCWADPTTHRLLVDLAGGNTYTASDSIVLTGSNFTLVNDSAAPTASQYYGTNSSSVLGYFNLPSGTGTVSTVSVVTANGFAGTVANATTTPAITISTGITGVLKGNGTAISAATAGTDYVVGSTGLAGGQTIAGGTLTTQNLTLRANAADTTTGSVAITTSTASTTKTTGALTIAGGLGVAGAIFSNDLTVTNKITGSISGNADGSAGSATYAGTVTLANDTGSATDYLVFANTATGNIALKTNTGVTVNPNTAAITATTFIGALSGNATTATTATTGTNATNTAITDDTTTNATMYPTWVTANTGNLPQKVTSTKLTFNPSTGNLIATTHNGLTITTTTGTFTLTNAKTLSVSDTTTLATNAITLGGGEVITFSASNALSLLTTGTTVMTFPAVTDTVAVLGTAQTYTATQTEKQVAWTNNPITASGNAATVPITSRFNTVTNNSAAGLTITLTTTSAADGMMLIVRSLPSSNVAQTITWVNTEISDITPSANLNASTTSPRTDGFMYNSGTSKWRCVASC